MKFHPEDPRLTAYVLGELPAEEHPAVVEASASDPAVRAALDGTRRIQRQLLEALAPQPAALLPGQLESIRHHSRQGLPEKPAKSAAHPRWLLPMVGVAVAGIIAMLVMNQPPDKNAAPVSRLPAVEATAPVPATTPTVVTPPSAAPAPVAPAIAVPDLPLLPPAFVVLPFPGPIVVGEPATAPAPPSQLATDVLDRDKLLHDAPAAYAARAAATLAALTDFDPATLPATLPRDPVSTAVSRQLPLPILAGRASAAWIAASVANHVLPPARAVRLEEILNTFDFRPAGNTGILKGISLSAESLACPWKPSTTLLLIHLQGAAVGSRTVEARLDIDPAAVSQFRLLGYPLLKGIQAGALPDQLPGKTGTTLLIEIEPRASAKALGEIHWKVDGTEGSALPILRIPETEPSADARFAALLAAWSMWLHHEQPEIVDEELVAGMARAYAANNVPKDRAEMLVLIAKSLELGK